MTFIRASISGKELNINMLIKIHEWYKWNPIPIFPIETITLWFVFLLILVVITIFKPTFYYSVLYLANIVLE